MVLSSWLVRASSINDVRREVLNDLGRVSPIILDMGWWEIFVCV